MPKKGAKRSSASFKGTYDSSGLFEFAHSIVENKRAIYCVSFCHEPVDLDLIASYKNSMWGCQTDTVHFSTDTEENETKMDESEQCNNMKKHVPIVNNSSKTTNQISSAVPNHTIDTTQTPMEKQHETTLEQVVKRYGRIFASVGGNRITIYECYQDNTYPLQAYMDQDIHEEYFTCAWSVEAGSAIPRLAVAGHRGAIRIFDCLQQNLVQTLRGHGNCVNQVKWHPIDDYLLLSASKDESIRLWNVDTGICIAIFAGDKGHRDEVLSIDIHTLGHAFASGGMDNTIKVWSLDDSEISDAISRSRTAHVRQSTQPSTQLDTTPNSTNTSNSIKPFHHVIRQFPLFSTTRVHVDYVDDLLWVGNLLLSKSTANRCVLWAPDPRRGKEAVTIFREYPYHAGELWFVRMCLTTEQSLLAVGNGAGDVYVFRIQGELYDETIEETSEMSDATQQHSEHTLHSSIPEAETVQQSTTQAAINRANDTHSTLTDSSMRLNASTSTESSKDTTTTAITSSNKETTTTTTTSTTSSRDTTNLSRTTESSKTSSALNYVRCQHDVKHVTVLSAPDCGPTIVRQASFSSDGKILVYCCDDGTVWRWNVSGLDENSFQ